MLNPISAGGSVRPYILADGRKMDGESTGVGHYERSLYLELSRYADLAVLKGSGWQFHVGSVIRTLRKPSAVYFSPESLVAPAILGRKSMLTIHDLSPLTHAGRHTLRNILFHKALLRLAARRTGAIFVPTEAVRRDVRRLLGERVAAKTHVVHEGVRFVHSEIADISERRNVVLYVGTIEPRKNVALLCRAFEKAKRQDSVFADWELTLVGKRGWLSSREEHDLNEAIKNSGAKELGYQGDDEVHRQLHSAGIFCYVSEAEGFGLPPLEAMASGAPVIVSSDPALCEVVDGAGIIVELGSGLEDDLTAAIVDLFGNSEKRALLQTKGARRAKEFSWTAAAQTTAAVAASIVSKNARSH